MNQAEENRRPGPPEEIRLFLESQRERHGPAEYHRFRIDRFLGFGKYKIIRTLSPTYGTCPFILPEDIPYICGYCIAVMEMDASDPEGEAPIKKRLPDGRIEVFRYRIHVFGMSDDGRFEWSKHVDLDAHCD